METLKTLQIINKVPRDQRIDGKSLAKCITAMNGAEVKIVELKSLYVPEYLLCSIMKEIMEDPVTLESGSTYDRVNIEMYFQQKKEEAAREIQNSSIDSMDGVKLTEADFMKCPTTLQKVDPSILIPNNSIKEASKLFLQ